MTHLEFRAALDALGLYQAEAARLIGVDEGTVRRWMAGPNAKRGRDVPEPVARFLRLLIAARISPEKAMELLS